MHYSILWRYMPLLILGWQLCAELKCVRRQNLKGCTPHSLISTPQLHTYNGKKKKYIVIFELWFLIGCYAFSLSSSETT